MKAGEIVEQGSHQELIQKPGGAYATLIRLQASTHQPALPTAVQPSEQGLKHSTQPELVQAYSTSQVICHQSAVTRC